MASLVVWRDARRAPSCFRLIVSGPVGVKEIERLIQKLQLDKEILTDQESGKDEAAN